MIDIINKRRSIRKYLNQPVEEEKIISLLKAAMNAPTAKNRQEWRFAVISDKELLTRFATEVSPYTSMVKDASYAIVVSGDLHVTPSKEYICVDCAAAIENMLLCAVELELGCCWCGLADNEDRVSKTKQLLNLPDNFYPVAIVAIGYPDEVKEPNNRYDPEKVTYYR